MSIASKAARNLVGKNSKTSKPPATEEQGVSLEPVLEAMRRRLPRARHAEGDAFVSAFYRRMSQDELAQHSAEGWAALAVGFLDFARERKPGTALVRLFYPNLQTHGWESPHTVLQVANDDMPFLVDTVTLALSEQGIGIHVLGHPVVTFQRDKGGNLVSIGGGTAESLMHLEIDRQSAESMAKVKRVIESVLADVRAMVRDWSKMKERMQEVADDLATRKLPVDDAARLEAQEFLRWASDDHFTFLGYREYEVVKENDDEVMRAVKGTGLGLMRAHDAGKPRSVKSLPAYSARRSGGAPDVLILTKTNARSTVHRRGYMDYIGVLSFDNRGRAVREQRFVGLYTSSAYTAVRGTSRWCASATSR